MPQARDEAGNIWETDAQGNAVRLLQAAGPQMPADPSFPYQGPKAAAEVTGSALENRITEATLPDVIRKTKADADKAEADAQAAAATAARGPEPSATEVEQAAKTEGQRRKAQVVRQIMGEVQGLYTKSIKGQPLSRGFGLTERIDSLPANEEFRIAAENILPLIRPMIAQSAKEGDSDREMQIFQSYIPHNDDSDRTIERKLKQLEMLVGGLVDGIPPSQSLTAPQQERRDAPPAVNDPRQMIPGTGGSSQMERATGETFSTPEDVAVAEAINTAYRSGGGVREMIAASQRHGRPVSVQQASEWQRAVDYRDGTGAYQGQPGGFSPVNTPESGRRNFAEQVWGDIGASAPGTFAINAADQFALGGGLDEIMGGINSLVNGTSYDAETAYANLGKQAVSAEHPGFALAGGLAGGIGQGYGIGRLAPKLTSALLKTAPRIAAAGGAYGALGGALESNNDRFEGGLGGAAIGAGGGLFGAKVAAPVMDAISRSAPMQRIARALKIEQDIPAFSPGERSLPQIDQMGGVRTNMQDAARLNLPYALADADPKLRVLAGTVTRKSPNARELAETTFDPRARGQAERAFDAIDTRLAPVTDIAERGAQWKQAAQTASSPFYAAGRQRAAPVDPRVAAFLETPAGKTALTNAREMAGNEGRDPLAMGFDLDDQGEVVIREMPSWETLDYVKRGIDQQLEPFRNPLTRKLDLESNPAAQSLERFRQNFLSTLDELNPDYAKARAAYSEQIRNRDALQIGQRAPGMNVKPRDLPRITGGMNDAQMGEFRRGYATSLADTVNDTRLAGNPYDRVFGTPNQQEKIGQVFPNAADFRRTYDLEGDMAKTRYETIGGSPTAARIAADGQMGDMLGAGVEIGADVLTGGGASGLGALINAGRRIAGDSLRMGVGKRAARNAERIAPTLFNTNPADAIAYLDDLALRQAADAVRKGEFRRRGGLFGSTLFSSGALAVPQS